MLPAAQVTTKQQLIDWAGMEWNGMEWNGLEWNGMEWNGMDWIGMESTVVRLAGSGTCHGTDAIASIQMVAKRLTPVAEQAQSRCQLFVCQCCPGHESWPGMCNAPPMMMVGTSISCR